MSFVERLVILCPYLGESPIRGSTVVNVYLHSLATKCATEDLFLWETCIFVASPTDNEDLQ